MIGNEMLEEALEKCGGSQRALASALGIKPSGLNRRIRGNRGVALETALALANFLGRDFGPVIREYTGLGEVRP